MSGAITSRAAEANALIRSVPIGVSCSDWAAFMAS